jgi:hypothetical protein
MRQSSISWISKTLRPRPSCCNRNAACTPSDIAYSNFLEFFASLSDKENVSRILDAERLGLAAIVKYGIISMGGTLDNRIFEEASEICFSCWLRLIKHALNDHFNIKTVLLAGVYVLSRLKGPPSWGFESMQNFVFKQPPFPLGTGIPRTITFTRLSHISALILNARQIGVSFAELTDDDSDSPFMPSCQMQSAGYHAAIYRPFAPDLQPVQEQMAVPHHPYLDIIPLPSFRARALSVLNSSDLKFREDELCFDLMHDGLRCWGSSQASLHGRGEGTPWDARSWEVSPWFFKKWAILFGNENDPIYRNSLWWWAQK